jgi:ParB-like chromosome segregation protein Spo0J
MKISEIVVDATVQIRRHRSRAETIERYTASFDNLPPAVVFDTEEGKLLADGFARVEVAKRLGRATIEADVRKGTRADARAYAAIANATSGDPLTVDERNDAILRLSRESGWTQQRIAAQMHVSQPTVVEVLTADSLRTELRRAEAVSPGDKVKADKQIKPASDLSRTHLRTIARAEPEAQVPLAQAAAARGWTREQTVQAVRNLDDPRVPQRDKAALLKGKADPTVVTDNGFYPHPDTVHRAVKVSTAPTPGAAALERALTALAEAERHGVDNTLASINGDRARQIAALIPGHVSFLNSVRKAATGS